MVDIAMLLATCHALQANPAEGEMTLHRKQRNRLRRDIKRGTVAYIDALARSRRGVVDDAFLSKCRLTAEAEMAHALAQQELLRRIMASEPGALAGQAAARQDLWRLAHVAIYLSSGMTALRESGRLVHAKPADVLAGGLRRRFRKALIAYARASLRTKPPKERLIVKAREAALAEIGSRSVAEAERLSVVEADVGTALTHIRQGVWKPLVNLTLDWRRQDSETS